MVIEQHAIDRVFIEFLDTIVGIVSVIELVFTARIGEAFHRYVVISLGIVNNQYVHN
jgi:hypothetical protein